MARLRAKDGCPWDKEQTHESILSCLVEESAEFIDAVNAKDIPNMEEELGDLLLQVVFHAQMGKEKELFDINSVIQSIASKLVRRHPHVFGDVQVENSEGVIRNWEKIKQEEKKEERTSALDGVPATLSPLLKAYKIQKKASKQGFDWPDAKGPMEKIQEELLEFGEEVKKAGTKQEDKERLEEEFGDLLFSMVNSARHLDIDPFLALEKSNHKFARRFKAVEAKVRESSQNMKDLPLEKLDEYWDFAKSEEKT